MLIFLSLHINMVLVLSCLAAETALFVFVFVAFSMVSLTNTTAINVVMLGAGAVVTTLILALLGNVRNIYSYFSNEVVAIGAAFVCILLFLVVHSLDHATSDVYINLNIISALQVLAT